MRRNHNTNHQTTATRFALGQPTSRPEPKKHSRFRDRPRLSSYAVTCPVIGECAALGSTVSPL
jgi:hypothetical protein